MIGGSLPCEVAAKKLENNIVVDDEVTPGAEFWPPSRMIEPLPFWSRFKDIKVICGRGVDEGVGIGVGVGVGVGVITGVGVGVGVTTPPLNTTPYPFSSA